MAIDKNVGYGPGKKRSEIDEYLQNRKLSAVYRKIQILERLTQKYHNLESVHQLQKKTVRNCMHNVMSPLSAVSGYFDLLVANLNQDTDSDKIERYSRKVSDGLNEVGFLLEQLHEMYKADQECVPVVELNWLVGEVKNVIYNSTDLRADKIVCNSMEKPVFVEAELFQLKLMIYNLITSADKLSTDTSCLEIEIDAKNDCAILTVSCKGEIVMDENLMNVFEDRQTLLITNEVDEKSPILFGLKSCLQFAEQVQGTISINVKNSDNPQFVFTAPLVQSDEWDLSVNNNGSTVKKTG